MTSSAQSNSGPSGRRRRYIKFFKPYGVLSQFTDAAGRPTIGDHVDVPGVYAAGRLDKNSEGLMLLTDDGWLNHRLTHPRFEHPKTYLVQVEGTPGLEALAHLRRGVQVKGELTRPAEVELLRQAPELPPPPGPCSPSSEAAGGVAAHGAPRRAQAANPPHDGRRRPPNVAPGAGGHRADHSW